MSNEILNTLIFALFAVAGMVLKQPVTGFLNSTAGQKNTATLIDAAKIAVGFAEQTLKGAPNSKKKDEALAALAGLNESKKLGFSQEQLEIALEAAVRGLPHKLEQYFGVEAAEAAVAQSAQPVEGQAQEGN